VLVELIEDDLVLGARLRPMTMRMPSVGLVAELVAAMSVMTRRDQLAMRSMSLALLTW